MFRYNPKVNYQPNGGRYLQILSGKDLYKQTIVVSVGTHDDTFPARFPNIFIDYPLGSMNVGDKLWTNCNLVPRASDSVLWFFCSISDSGTHCYCCKPTNALLHDQIKKLRELGVNAGLLANSTCQNLEELWYSSDALSEPVSDDDESPEDLGLSTSLSSIKLAETESLVDSTKTDVVGGKCSIVYCHPEVIVSPQNTTRKLLVGEKYQKNVIACIIDEAHCIMDWGDK